MKNKSRTICIMSIAGILTMGVFVGCGSSSNTQAGNSIQSATTDTSIENSITEAAPDTSVSVMSTDDTKYTQAELKLSHHNATDQPIHEELTKWADMVHEKTGGAVTIDIYPAASLYNSEDAKEAVKNGALDMCLGDTSILSTDFPQYTLYSLPFLLDSYDHADQIVNGDIGAKLDKELEDDLGIVPLGWTWNGFRDFCTTKPITSVADCKNIKLRSPGAQIYLDTFTKLGMNPTVISWSEAYSAMQSGVVDGVESGLESFYTQGFYNLGKNICVSHHMISIIGPIINKNVWDGLNEATQQVMKDSWKECQAELNQTVIDHEDGYYQKLQDKGCNMTEFENRQELIDLFKEYWTSSAKSCGAEDELQAMIDICSKE